MHEVRFVRMKNFIYNIVYVPHQYAKDSNSNLGTTRFEFRI